MKEKLSVGFYFTAVAAVLALVGAVMYGSVMYKVTSVYVFLIAAVAVEIIAFVLSRMKMSIPVYAALPVINAVLTASAAVWAVSLMVNQIGYVIAELDGPETITSFIYYEVVVIIAMLINIIAAFLPLKKEAAK